MSLREPIGTHFVQVCTTTPCGLRGASDVLKTVCSHLGGIKPGETTKDGKFTVVEVECQGACSNAPMMVVGDEFYVRSRSRSFFFYLRLTTTALSSHDTGGPHTGNYQESPRCFRQGRETQTRSSERQTDVRERGRTDKLDVKTVWTRRTLSA